MKWPSTLTLTKHVLMPKQWICNEDFFQSLTPEQQQWLCETGDEAGVYNNQMQDELLGAVHGGHGGQRR
jgi:TRAP-type C4-dicarboxylate transport system substrate-binding protein